MSDLVELLRDYADDLDMFDKAAGSELPREAADEIERLKDRLDDDAKMQCGMPCNNWDERDMFKRFGKCRICVQVELMNLQRENEILRANATGTTIAALSDQEPYDAGL